MPSRKCHLIQSATTSTAVFLLMLSIQGCGKSDDGSMEVDGVRVIGTAGRQPGQFSKPRAVAITKSRRIVVIDRTGRVILHDLDTGEFVHQWRLPKWDNGTPTGISVDPIDDSIWLADTHYSQVLQYDQEGNLVFRFGEYGTGPGQFIFLTDVCPDPDGKTLWITDYGARNRVMQFTRTGEFVKEWGPPIHENVDLQRPMAILLAPDGQRLYVVDTGNNRVNMYSRDGDHLGSFGSDGDAPGAFRYPQDICLAPDNTLYLVEYGNARLSRFTLDGKFLGVWGEPGHGTGQFFLPWGIAASTDGKLVVADTMNQRLQVLDDPDRLFDDTQRIATGSAATLSGTAQQ